MRLREKSKAAVASPPATTAWLIQRKHGRTKFYLIPRGGWSVDSNEAEQFPDEAAARTKLRVRQGTPVLFALA